VLLDVVLGQRERFEDWLEMGRDLVRRGLRAPMLVVTDGAPGLIRAMEELWPDSDRQRCTVHRWRNVAGKLPKNDTQLHERVEATYWAALDDATSPADGEARLRRLVTDLERSYPSAAACLAEDLPALCVHLAYPLRLRGRRTDDQTDATILGVRLGSSPQEWPPTVVIDFTMSGRRGTWHVASASLFLDRGPVSDAADWFAQIAWEAFPELQATGYVRDGMWIPNQPP